MSPEWAALRRPHRIEDTEKLGELIGSKLWELTGGFTSDVVKFF
jgi:hypothetical protein